MNWRLAWAVLWADPPEPVDERLNTTAYQVGVQNGIAIGEYRGRHRTIGELELLLAARNQSLDDVETADLELAKQRICH